ncbi:MAG: sigma factor-like helix-turn-helix DNA-binding protein [Lachnospirales bacterium]
MEDIFKITVMYDLYSPMLTDKQKNIFELYYMNDYSFSEIGELLDVSKASAFDLLNRTKAKIFDYEKKLKLYEKFIEQQEILLKIKEELNFLEDKRVNKALDNLELLINNING